MSSVMWNLVAASAESTLSNFSAPKTQPREKVQVHHVQLVQITKQRVWPCLVFSNYPELMNRLGSVLSEEEWSKVQNKLSVEFQRHVMSNCKQMKQAADMPVVFLLGKTTPCETASVYGVPEHSACVGSEVFVAVMSNLAAKGVFRNEEFQQALEQMMNISQMASQWPQEALQEPPADPVATTGPTATNNSLTLVMDEDESLAGVGKGKRKEPKQAPTEPKDPVFETPEKIRGGKTSSAGPPLENPPMQEDENEYRIEEIDQVEQQIDDEEKSRESDDAAASAVAIAMELDSPSVKSTSSKRKGGTKRKAKTPRKRSPGPKRTKSKIDRQLYEDLGITLQIPTFKQVKPLLKMAGYTFRKGVYCRPKGDPKQHPNAVEGNDYFTTESAFREFLCRSGVDCNEDSWTDTIKKNAIPNVLTPWIRYNVIKSRKDEMVLPTLVLSDRNALHLLHKKLNFRYWVHLMGYILPGVPKEEVKIGVNAFAEKPDLWVYLARHGLPDNCPFEKISPLERLALEQFLSFFDGEDVDLYHEKNAFEDWRTAPPPADQESRHPAADEQMESASDNACDSASDVQSPTPSTPHCEEIPAGVADESRLDRSPESDSEAFVASNRAPPTEKESASSGPTRNILNQLDHTMDEQPTENTRVEVADSGVAETNDSEQESAAEVNATRRSTMSRVVSESVEVVEEERKSENNKQTPTEKPRSADKDGAGNELPTLPASPPKPLPELETTVGAKLQKCKEMLKLASGEITFGGEHSKTTARVQRITQFLRAVIESKGEHGGKRGEPAALHVCGVPGTGKTMAVDWCCNKALEWAKESAEEWDKAPNFCRINGSHYQNLTKKVAFDDVKEALSMSMGQTFSENAVKRSKTTEKSTVILVIDEIDLLVSDKSENFLSTLLSWALNEQTTFGIIGISNAVENSKARRLHTLGGFKDKVVFQTYDKNDLVSIVKSRIGSTIVDSKVIEFVASKVAATSGDARKVLEMTSKSIDKCIEKMPKTRRDSNEEGTIVKLQFAMMAIRENITKYADLINGLTLMGKSILCVATRLARHVDLIELTLGTLKNYCMDAFGHDAMLDEVSMEDFKSVVENLVDGGLLCVAECDRKKLSTESFHNLAMMPIRLDLQLEDVESAVEEELLKQDFYSSLLARLASRGRR